MPTAHNLSVMKNIAAIVRIGKAGVALAALLSVVPVAAAKLPEGSFVDMIGKFALVPPGKHDSEMLARATVAIDYIRKMDLPRAHLAVNEALQLDARNSYLHFLNGFVYHLQAKQGDTQKGEIAIEGYQQALRIDPNNWIAQEFLGLAYMDLKQFSQAKIQFSEVLLVTPESTVSIYGLMVASYLTGDARTACAMADQFKRASSEAHPGFVRSSISVYASCGNFEQADRMRETLSELSGGGPETERVDRRLAQWKTFYRQREQGTSSLGTSSSSGLVKTAWGNKDSTDAPPVQLAQAFKLPNLKPPASTSPTPPSVEEPAAAPAAGAPAAPDAGPESPRMLLIDVVLLSTQELISTSKGVNLLNALTLQLGSVAGNVPAFSRVTTSTNPGDTTTAITRAVTVPALSYSLNIANANNSVNEVLARPTLAAIEGLPSEFFSGTNLSAGVVSTSTQGGTTVVPLDKRFGIKLAVTPRFLPRGQVQLKVDAQRTSLQASSDNPRVAYQIEIAEILANANVVMKLGDTLVLSGLSEKSTASTRDGVPGLQDVPLVQYLFSNKRTNDIQRSVLILVTPRAPVQVAEADRGAGDTTANMKALRDKFGLSASIPSNVEAIMNQLKPGDFFREFRQGDVSMERWDRMRSTGDRLREALEFLYY
jgi:pilus assembly protein CpaC